MKFKIKAFGITRDIMGGREVTIECDEQTVAALRHTLLTMYPDLHGLKSLMVAVNNEYAEDTASLEEGDEIALIPPVSGG